MYSRDHWVQSNRDDEALSEKAEGMSLCMFVRLMGMSLILLLRSV